MAAFKSLSLSGAVQLSHLLTLCDKDSDSREGTTVRTGFTTGIKPIYDHAINCHTECFSKTLIYPTPIMGGSVN
jgi:hypothetical protein